MGLVRTQRVGEGADIHVSNGTLEVRIKKIGFVNKLAEEPELVDSPSGLQNWVKAAMVSVSGVEETTEYLLKAGDEAQKLPDDIEIGVLNHFPLNKGKASMLYIAPVGYLIDRVED